METKRAKPKNPIHFQIELNSEQKEAKETILNNKITVLRGKAGSGKTLVAIMAALDLLFKKEVEKIVLSRAIVTAGEEVGILPGNEKEKLAPYIAPLMDALYSAYSKDKIDSLIQEGKITVIPVGLMRGRNLSNCVAVIDEAQNITDVQTKLILTRLCKGSKFVFCGDVDQIDLEGKKVSGFDFICRKMITVNKFKVIELLTNHRDEIVDEILNIYAEYK